jgi:hypothetical protein
MVQQVQQERLAAEQAVAAAAAAELRAIEEAAEAEEEQREDTFRKREAARLARQQAGNVHDPFAPDFLKKGGGKPNPFAAVSGGDKQDSDLEVSGPTLGSLPFAFPMLEDEVPAYDDDADILDANGALAELAKQIRQAFSPLLPLCADRFDAHSVVERYAKLMRLEKDADEEDLFAGFSPTKEATDESKGVATELHASMHRLEQQLRLLPELRVKALNECTGDADLLQSVEVSISCCQLLSSMSLVDGNLTMPCYSAECKQSVQPTRPSWTLPTFSWKSSTKCDTT